MKILWYFLGKRLYYLVTKPENIGYLKLICITKRKHYDQTQLLEKFVCLAIIRPGIRFLW